MSTTDPLKIALLICSTRVPRLSPSLAAWVSSVLSTNSNSTHELQVIDLKSFPLPLSPIGATIPAYLPLPLSHDAYGPEKENEVVNHWSRTVRGFDGFIFVMPQYNWNIPGVLKVALDALFHEWKGKPCGIVSYGKFGIGLCLLPAFVLFLHASIRDAY
jgi:NAD(P)H-dependent FMN reductase